MKNLGFAYTPSEEELRDLVLQLAEELTELELRTVMEKVQNIYASA